MTKVVDIKKSEGIRFWLHLQIATRLESVPQEKKYGPYIMYKEIAIMEV